MPVADVTSSTKVFEVSLEAVLFTDGASAGTVQQIKLDYDGIMSATGERIGNDGDTSLVWTTGSVLTTQVPWRFKNHSEKDNATDRLATLANGEYMVDHENGFILGKAAIATSSTSDSVTYSVRTRVSTVEGDISITNGSVSSDNTDAYSVDQSDLLESGSVSKNSSGNLYKVAGRLDRTAPTGVYYVQLLNASSVPADGAVTLLFTPIKLVHTTGIDTYFDLDASPAGLPATSGIVWVLSSTEFTKTLAGDFCSVVALYK